MEVRRGKGFMGVVRCHVVTEVQPVLSGDSQLGHGLYESQSKVQRQTGHDREGIQELGVSWAIYQTLDEHGAVVTCTRMEEVKGGCEWEGVSFQKWVRSAGRSNNRYLLQTMTGCVCNLFRKFSPRRKVRQTQIKYSVWRKVTYLYSD